MARYFLHPAVGVAAASLVLAHLGVTYLPVTLGGLPTPVVMIAGACGAILSAIRFL